MNPRTTGILFLVAAALAAFVFFYEIRGEEGRKQAEEALDRLFPGIEATDVEWIALTSSDGTACRAERRPGGWEIVEPFEFPADDYAFDSIASTLAQIASESVIEDPQDVAVYGLDADERIVRFSAGGEEHALRVGDKTPLGSNSYVSAGAAGSIHTVPTYRVASLSKSFDELREKRVLHFDQNAVERIEVSWPDGGVVLQRGEDGWRIAAPLQGPADAATVDALLSDLSFLRASGFVDARPADAEAGLDRPAWAVTLSLAAEGEGGEPSSLRLAIGRDVGDKSRLVRAAQASLYRIPEDRLRDFPADLVAYRFKQLAEFATEDARRVEIVFHTEGGETVAIAAERNEEDWSSEPESFKPGAVSELVDTLSNLRARDILADAMGPEELEELGLSPANAVISVFGEAPEEADGDRASKLAEVRLGIVRGGDGIAAQAEGQESVFELDYEIAEHVPVSLTAFENRFRADADAETEAESPSPDPS